MIIYQDILYEPKYQQLLVEGMGTILLKGLNQISQGILIKFIKIILFSQKAVAYSN